MRLLITRAAADADRTRAALEARGHAAVVSPLTEIVGADAAWPGGAIDALVATSAQAFAFPPEMPAHTRTTLPLFLVGQRALEEARMRGFAGRATCAPDVAGLIAEIGAAGDASMRLVYWAGRDRKSDLEAALGRHGHTLDVVEAYVARAASGLSEEAVCALKAGTIDAVLHFSRRSADLFLTACERADVNAASFAHICLSADVAASLREAACVRLETAKAPNEAALFSLLDA